MQKKYKMSIKQLFFTVVLFIPIHSFGQQQDKKQIDSSDVSYRSSLYFVQYMNENKIDSTKNILSYWENECGTSEPVYRAKIILALKTGQLNDTLLADNPIGNILNYQNRMRMIKYSMYHQYDKRQSYYGFIPLNQAFDNYIHGLALELKANYNQESIEYLLVELYSDNCDTIFSKIQSKTYEKSFLRGEYNKVLEKYKKIPEVHVSSFIGVWIPTGNLTIIGHHPELGFQVGLKRKKMNYDFTIAFKFMKSPNEYYAIDNNFLIPTICFAGRYIGFDIGKDMFVKKGHEIQLIGGIAYDGFNVLDKDKRKMFKYIATATYNVNFGFSYRYYITNDFYFGLMAKYHLVDYTLNNVIYYTGCPITVHFAIGTVFNSYRNEKLKDLKYMLRK